jgi:hypothetical protein
MDKIIQFPEQQKADPTLIAQFRFLALALPHELAEIPIPYDRIVKLAEEDARRYFQQRFALFAVATPEVIDITSVQAPKS